MKLAKRILTLGLAAAMTVALAACDMGDNMKKDSQTYVQGLLDKYYKGQYNKDYLELIDLTEAEAEEQYLDWVDQEVDYFCYYFDVEYPTDEFRAEVSEFYKQVYAQSNYVVHEATKLESGNYAVEVTVQPMDIMLQITEDDAAMIDEAAFADAFGDLDEEGINAMDDDAYEEAYLAYDAAHGQGMLDALKSHLGEVGYGDEKSMIFQLAKDSDGYYSLVEGDIQNFDNYVIEY